MTKDLRVHPGPPDYTYAAALLDVIDGNHLAVNLGLGHIGPGLRSAQDIDFGFGLRRIDGWLVKHTTLELAEIHVLAEVGPEILRNLFTSDTLIVKITSIEGLWPSAIVYQYGEVKSVNERMVEAGYAVRTGPKPVRVTP